MSVSDIFTLCFVTAICQTIGLDFPLLWYLVDQQHFSFGILVQCCPNGETTS